MEMMEQYLNEQYFSYLLIVVGAYFLVWLITFILTRPSLNLLKAGNPYIGICNFWLYTILMHTLLTIGFSILTCKMMVENQREPVDVIVYNIGFFICFLINILVIARLAGKKSKITVI
ncbi:hypothetical protein [Desulfobacter latus]|uniref:Uncharacterized protein n=1 Tax=Desulfobacter latus TaxID=2292 RepID=A0A850T0Q3_9BACT|nr:hypothetical protein [Desulfobacter latus]NWH05910.1 hypothetical protein [Desulfobacter latus]